MYQSQKKWSEMTEAERDAAIAARSQKLEQARQKLEQGVQQILTSGRWKEYLDFMAHFHHYSFNNLILILLQNPRASMCASYRTWEQLGRHVKKGERGIEILVPVLAKVEANTDSDGLKKKTSQPLEDLSGCDAHQQHPQKLELQKLVGFKVGHTFDVSQTEGEPIPNLVNVALSGDDQGVFSALSTFSEKVLHLPVGLVQSRDPNWGGACHYDDAGKPILIRIAANRSPLFRAQVPAHELAHAILHSGMEYRLHNPRSRIELEAESVSYCILHHFGLDVGEVAFGYVALWGEGENALKELMQSGQRIRDTAHKVITWIEEEYAAPSTILSAAVSGLPQSVSTSV